MEPFPTYDDLLATIRSSGHEYRTIGHAPNRQPLVAVTTGGTKTPPMCVLTGAHANEHAGVMATVKIIDALETDHRVWVVPCRDPVGLNGYQAATSLATLESAELHTHEDVVGLLESVGDVLYTDNATGIVLGLIGDYGYASKPPESDVFLLQWLKELAVTNPDVLAPVRGRRIYTTVPDPTVEGAIGLERAYTTVIRPDGQPLHLNRFFADPWEPPESRAVRGLLDQIEPGLTVDNHETGAVDDRVYVVCRPADDTHQLNQSRRVGRAMAAAMAETGATLATDGDLLSSPTTDVGFKAQEPTQQFYSRAGPGAYWMDYAATTPARGGEGPNAGDYAARHHGVAIDVETGMHAPLESRAKATIAAVQAGIDHWERTLV